MRYLKNILKIFSFSLFFCLAILAFEVSLKAFFPIYDPSGKVELQSIDGVPLLAHRESYRKQWKNTGDYNVDIYANELGFRNRKNLKNSNKDWLFVVGDSFSFGHGVNEENRFSDLLETDFNLGNVANIAIATDIDGYAKLIKYAQANGAKINKIILGLCIENDFKIYNEPNKPKGGKSDFGLYNLKAFLKNNTASYNMFTQAVHGNNFLQKMFKKMGLINETYTSIEPHSKEIVRNTIERIRELFDDVNADESHVLLIPHRGIWLDKKRKEHLEVHYLIKSLLNEMTINVIDPLDSFEESDDPMIYLFKHDGHWNKMGHKLVSEVIFKSLKKM